MAKQYTLDLFVRPNGVRAVTNLTKELERLDLHEINRVPEPSAAAPPLPAGNETSLLFNDLPLDWEKHWEGMPSFRHNDLEPFRSIKVHFRNREDVSRFSELIGQKLGERLPSIWYPEATIGRIADKSYRSAAPLNPRYPIFIVSKGRWESRLTVKALDKIGVPYRIVVEPPEYDAYRAVIPEDRIIVLPFHNLGQGSIPARNFIWDFARNEGHERHWILDDNISGFYRFEDNLKCPVGDGTIFRAAEDYTDLYENVPISGFNYFMFVKRKYIIPPYTLNTRIYSCILLSNKVDYRWRGRYNEDTDLSIRILKDGCCSILFNAFLAYKMPTMTIKGGNDELYKDDGRTKMAQLLRQQHPDIVTVTRKFGRDQHHVNYKIFRRNALIRKDGAALNTADYEMTRHIISKPSPTLD